MKVQLCRFLLKYYYVQQIVCLNFIFCIKNFIIIINNVIVESLGDNFFWGFILWKIGATWIIFCAVSFLFITCLKTFYKNQQYITLYISHFQTKWIKKPWLLVFSLYIMYKVIVLRWSYSKNLVATKLGKKYYRNVKLSDSSAPFFIFFHKRVFHSFTTKIQ